jgi:hypothetical protein
MNVLQASWFWSSVNVPSSPLRTQKGPWSLNATRDWLVTYSIDLLYCTLSNRVCQHLNIAGCCCQPQIDLLGRFLYTPLNKCSTESSFHENPNQMENRFPISLLTIPFLAISASVALPAFAQEPLPAVWNPTHTLDGQPDVGGFWASVTDGVYTPPPTEELGLGGRRQGKMPSRITDPPDHQVPYQPWARIKQQYIASNVNDPTKEEFIDTQARCLPDGPVRDAFWHDFQFLQYPGYVVIVYGGGHDFRIISLDGRPHPGQDMKLWMGDSRGHWEGTTLVVDVTNNNSKWRLSHQGDFASDHLHLVERYIFVDAKHLRYEATFEDPTVYTRPWKIGADFVSGIFPNGLPHPNKGIYMDTPKGYEQWEEACYEGEHNVADSLHQDSGTGK